MRGRGLPGAGQRRGLGRADMILLLSIMLGTAHALQMPAQQALMPTLVPLSLLARGRRLPAVPPCSCDDRRPGIGRRAICLGPWVSGMQGPHGRPVQAVQCPLGRGDCLLSRLRVDGRRRPGRAEHPATAGAAPAAGAWSGGTDGRHPLHLASRRDARRHVAGPVCRAAGRRHGAASDLRARHPAHRPLGPGLLRSAPALGALSSA